MVSGGVCANTIIMHSSSLCMQMAMQFTGARGASLHSMVAGGVCANTAMMYSSSLCMQEAVRYAGALYAVQARILESIYNFLAQVQGSVSLKVLTGFPSGAAFSSSASRGSPLLCSSRGGSPSVACGDCLSC